MQVSKIQSYNSSINDKRTSQNSKQQSFKGIGDASFNALNKVFNVLDKNAMIQVSFVDTVSTNIPRTIVDLKTNLAAALETCRREFSGLFVNCLMPGLIVKYLVANLLPKAKELKGTNVVNSWANSESINKLSEIYKQAHKINPVNSSKEYVKTALTSLEGLEGDKNWIKYSDFSHKQEFKSAVDDVTNAVSKQGKERKQLLSNAKEKLVGLTKAESILKFNGQPHSNLEETLRDITDLGSKFNFIKEKTANALKKSPDLLTNEELTGAVDKYCETLKSFVNKKSFIGLGIVLAIAVSMQSINRAITRKQFNAEGAPIYKDFGKKDTTKKMDETQKKEFWYKKLLAAASMYGLAALSMMKMPSKNMFQFSGIFPTLDQCRWIAASTFASRMVVSEDENELRETTIRDLASFSGLYFLGDYVKKATASAIEAFSKTETGKKIIGEKVVLLNRKPDDIPDKQKNKLQEFIYWIKKTDLKSANEVSSIKVRNLRNLCRVSDLAFSITVLGILLPMYNRMVTDKKVAETKKQEEFAVLEKEKNTPNIFKNIA